VKRKKGLTCEEFVQYPLDVHAPLALALPGLRDYALSFAEPKLEKRVSHTHSSFNERKNGSIMPFCSGVYGVMYS
jgi:hypothetical protein